MVYVCVLVCVSVSFGDSEWFVSTDQLLSPYQEEAETSTDWQQAFLLISDAQYGRLTWVTSWYKAARNGLITQRDSLNLIYHYVIVLSRKVVGYTFTKLEMLARFNWGILHFSFEKYFTPSMTHSFIVKRQNSQ